MVIFHSYVSLPEGKLFHMFQNASVISMCIPFFFLVISTIKTNIDPNDLPSPPLWIWPAHVGWKTSRADIDMINSPYTHHLNHIPCKTHAPYSCTGYSDYKQDNAQADFIIFHTVSHIPRIISLVWLVYQWYSIPLELWWNFSPPRYLVASVADLQLPCVPCGHPPQTVRSTTNSKGSAKVDVSKALVARHRFALWLSWIQHDRKQCQNKKTMGSPKGELLKQTNQGSYDRQQIQVLEKLLDIVG